MPTTMASVAIAAASLYVQSTNRFAVLECGEEISSDAAGNKAKAQQQLPLLALEDLLLHSQRGTTVAVQSQLKEALMKNGFCLLTVNNAKAARVVRCLRDSLHTDIFPASTTTTNGAGLQTSHTTYVSEKGVPMYKLGYELCEDGVREVFRVAGGSPHTVAWPVSTVNSTESTWMQGLGLLRHVTDTALDLLLQGDQIPVHRQRPHSGSSTWLKENKSEDLQERTGDFSVLYAMHYFNKGTQTEVEPGVAVKSHVDPSLLVVEPFLCPETTGLQVWDRIRNEWMDCDGPESPILSAVLRDDDNNDDPQCMLLFCGKALSAAVPEIEPTLHRVVTGHCPRRTVIYEQKYQEFYPPPSFD
jgi:hypothetical protein